MAWLSGLFEAELRVFEERGQVELLTLERGQLAVPLQR